MVRGRAFVSLKSSLTTTCVRAYHDPNRSCALHTDRSDYALGAVLSQADEEGSEKVIAYYSRSSTGAEINYPVHEKECLAIVAAIKHFHIYLGNLPFDLYTDHRSLATVLSWKEPNRRIYRWVAFLTQYDFTARYKKGSLHTIADALSRLASLHVKAPSSADLTQGYVMSRDGECACEGFFEHELPSYPEVKLSITRPNQPPKTLTVSHVRSFSLEPSYV